MVNCGVENWNPFSVNQVEPAELHILREFRTRADR